MFSSIMQLLFMLWMWQVFYKTKNSRDEGSSLNGQFTWALVWLEHRTLAPASTKMATIY